jgi:cell division protein FtsI/penicillin-binding protein 2
MQGGQESGDKQTNEMDGGQSEGVKMIKGDLLLIERYNYLVKGQDGKEVTLNIDKTIQKARNIELDDHIDKK